MRTIEPTTITSGEGLEWTRSLSDYPADTWTLEYRFRGDGQGFNVTATPDDLDHAVTVAATATAMMQSGRYEWQAWATNIADTTITRMIARGFVNVLRGFSADPTTAVDLRSPAKIMLDTLDAALLASGSADIVEYEVTTPAGGQRVKRESRSSVLSLRKYYAGIYARELRAAGGKFGRSVGIRMYEQ